MYFQPNILLNFTVGRIPHDFLSCDYGNVLIAAGVSEEASRLQENCCGGKWWHSNGTSVSHLPAFSVFFPKKR